VAGRAWACVKPIPLILRFSLRTDGGGPKEETRNRKHRRATAKPEACAKPIMLSTVGRKEKKKGG